jgi:starvation-inducible DNA-binding protein
MKAQNLKTVEKLNQLLADYQINYQNLRSLHWNVKGSMFFALHEKFEEYYNEAADVVDEIAERILTLGGVPLHTFGDYLKTAKLEEVRNVSDGKDAVASTLKSQRYFLTSFEDILVVANENNDEGTVGMISEWIGHTEKRIWMLEAFLG